MLLLTKGIKIMAVEKVNSSSSLVEFVDISHSWQRSCHKCLSTCCFSRYWVTSNLSQNSYFMALIENYSKYNYAKPVGWTSLAAVPGEATA